MRVVVVAKTRMGQNLCVGAVDATTGRPLRLIPKHDARYHSWESFEPGVGRIIDLQGTRASSIEPPHTEDFLVTRWQALAEVVDLPRFIEQHCDIWTGQPALLFGRCLDATESGSRFLAEGTTLPACSVGFWRPPWALYSRSSERDGKPRHHFVSASRFRFRVVYVGLDAPIECIPAHTLVRVSLARWNKFTDDPVSKCWLQLSGWFAAA